MLQQPVARMRGFITDALRSSIPIYTLGEGIADQRKAIVVGIRDSREIIQGTGIGNDEANQQFMFTQWTEMMNEFARGGKSATVVLPSGFQQDASMFDQMLTANQAADASREPAVEPKH